MKWRLILTIIVVFGTQCFGEIINVPEDFETIQAGINAAENGDTVLVAPGEYVENIELISRQIYLGSNLITTGDSDFIESTIINGNEQGSVVTFDEEDASTLQGFTITNGLAEQTGGGINCHNSSPMLVDLHVINNVSEAYAGGVWFLESDEVTIRRTLIAGNRAEFGGGLGEILSELHLFDVIISNNSAYLAGGLVGIGGSNTLQNVAIVNNDSRMNYGVGLYNAVGNIFTNVTISGNTRNAGDDESFALCVRSEDERNGRSELEMVNCIVFGNEPGHQIGVGGGWEGDRGSILTVTYCDIEGGEDDIVHSDNSEAIWGEGNINADPLFVNPEDIDYHLTENSPCIDTGDPESEPDPDGTRADMGAFYYIPAPDENPHRFDVSDEYDTIQAAIDATEDGDTVLVAPGEYVEMIDYLSKSIIVASHFLTTGNEEFIEQTIIDGNQEGPVVRIDRIGMFNRPALTGFTITNGLGGIMAWSPDDAFTMHISNNIVEHNLSNEDNPRGEAGSIVINSCSALIKNNVIRFNQSGIHGSGIYAMSPDTILIEGNEIYGNVAGGSGGGIYIYDSENIEVRNNIIYENTGSIGGGISFVESIPLIIDNTICFNSTLEWENEAGGGIYVSSSDPVFLINNIVYGNESALDPQIHVRRSELIAMFNNIALDVGGEGNINADPLFVDPENGDFNLSGDSPCIDAGTAFFIYEEDTLVDISDDNYIGDAPDMGAVEYDPADMRDDNEVVPSSFSLHPPFPNPFNSLVIISYSIPAPSKVSLQIFDINGKLVETLYAGISTTGIHSRVWDAESTAPGLYFLRLVHGVKTETRKIILVK